MAGWLCSTKSLSRLPVEKSLTCFVFWGNLNVAVCLSYSKASPPDRSMLLAHHKIHSTNNRKWTLTLVSFFVLCFRFILFLGVEIPSSGLKSVVSARLGNKHFGALLLLFKLVSGSASLLVYMAWDASNESLFFLEYVQWKDNFTPELVWICTEDDMATTCIQPWKAQLASHKSCNVSTCVYNTCSCRVGVNSYHVDTKCTLNTFSNLSSQTREKKQISRFSSFWISKKCTPTLVFILIVTQRHKHTHTDTHTDTHTTISKSLCSQPLLKYLIWLFSAAFKFFLILSFFFLNFWRKIIVETLCLLSLALCPCLPLKTPQLFFSINQTISK